MFGRVHADSPALSWRSSTHFTAKTDQKDLVTRVTNNVLFATGFCGMYAICAGISGFGLYFSCAAAGFTIRKIAAVLLGHVVYPASLTSYPSIKEYFALDKQKKLQTGWLLQNQYVVQRLTLHKSGTSYDAYLISHPKTEKTRRFAIHALGNCMTTEYCMIRFAQENLSQGCNTLLINGPSVGSSSGWPTQYQMGAGFEAGLQFLESALKASHIVIKTLSLGNGMMSEAILTHDFTEGMKNNVRYLCISDRTFSKLSTVAKALVGRMAKPLLFAAGLELDGIEAARKLSDLGIEQIIVQHSSKNRFGTDGVIPDSASLALELRKGPMLQGKTFVESEKITHNGDLPMEIQKDLSERVRKFFKRS